MQIKSECLFLYGHHVGNCRPSYFFKNLSDGRNETFASQYLHTAPKRISYRIQENTKIAQKIRESIRRNNNNTSSAFCRKKKKKKKRNKPHWNRRASIYLFEGHRAFSLYTLCV